MGLEFVRPATAILTLPGGNTLVVKRRLSHGEHQEALGRMVKERPDGGLVVDRRRIGMATVLAYLVDWDVEDGGKPVPLRGLSLEEVEATLDGLAPESFDEVREAVEAHEGAVAREHAKKKAPAGGSGPGPTSGSPSEPAGVSTGSGS